MAKLKKVKRLILFCLSLQTSVFEERKGSSFVPYKFLYRRLPLRPASIRNALGQLAESGEVNKLITNRQPLTELSTLGRKRLSEVVPSLLPVGKTKFGFLLAVFLPAPGSRKKLRKIRCLLTHSGFVPLGRGVYCGWQALAKETEKAVVNVGLAQQVILIPFDSALSFGLGELSNKLLDLPRKILNANAFITKLSQALTRNQLQNRRENKNNFGVREVLQEGFGHLKKLPALPKALMPAGWPVAELKKSLKMFSDRLEAENKN